MRKRLPYLRAVHIFTLVAASNAWAVRTPPSWWSDPNTQILTVNPTQNYAPLLNGQLKFMALQAKTYLHQKIPTANLVAVDTLVSSFKPVTGTTYSASELQDIRKGNYAPATIGQLKAVAKVFYDALNAAGFNCRQNLINRGFTPSWAGYYPFDPNPAAQNYTNLGIANIGQAKLIFSFDLTGFSTGDFDGSGITDTWEIQYLGGLGVDPQGDLDGDGLTNLKEFQIGTLPKNPDSDFDGISDSQEYLFGWNPSNSNDAPKKRIAYFPFDKSNWSSFEGSLPTYASGTQVPGFRAKGLNITGGQINVYPWKRADGGLNYSLRQGSVRLWFKPNWSSPGMSGYWSRLFELGGWTGDASTAFVALHFKASEPGMFYSTYDGNGHAEAADFSFASNTILAGRWHQIVITYSPTNRRLYLNGQLISDQAVAWSYDPDIQDIIASGVEFGSDGGQPINGVMDEVEVYNYELPASEISSDYASNAPSADTDGDGMPDSFEMQIVNFSSSDGITSISQVLPGDDFDGDGLNNLDEWTYRTNPTVQDSDGDVMNDKYEVDNNLLPTFDDAYDDQDNDQVPNIFEWANSTDPQVAASKPSPQYRVNQSGGGTHTTLQAAVAAAFSTSDTGNYRIVELAPGIYTGTANTGLNIYHSSKKILITSSDGAAQTTLDAQNARRVLSISSEAAVNGLRLINGAYSSGSGIYISARGGLSNCVIEDNADASYGGGMYIYSGNATKIRLRNVAINDGAANYGAGIYLTGSAFVEASEVRFERNAAAQDGGGIYVTGSARLEGRNIILLENTAQNGAAIYNSGGQVTIRQTTLFNNHAVIAGSSLWNYDWSGSFTATNAIFWSKGNASEIRPGGTASITTSIVRGGFIGTGNTTTDPLLTTDGHLAPTSPAINKASFDQMSKSDIDGEARPQGSIADLGADEWLDGDQDGLADWWESKYFPNAVSGASGDPDGDGLNNIGEYMASSSPVSFNGVQLISVPTSLDASFGPISATITFNAYTASNVTLKFYKFYYNTNTTNGDFGGYRFELIDTRTISAQSGLNTYQWNGMIGSPSVFHNADVVAVEVTTNGAGGSEIVGAPAAYNSSSVPSSWWSTNWNTANTTGSGTTVYRNMPFTFNYTLTKPLLLTTPNNNSILKHRPLKAGVNVVSDWIPIADNGGSGFNSQGVVNPTNVTARRLPENAIIYENNLPEVRNFTIQSYRTVPSNGEVGHIRFELTKATKVSFVLSDANLTFYTIYIRKSDGSYQIAENMDLPAGSYDFEFRALNYGSGFSSAKHFSYEKLRSTSSSDQFDGYFRVRVVWDKDLRTQSNGYPAVSQGFRWAYLYVE